MNFIIVLKHEDGERLPLLVDERGLPLIEPNVFILTQRGLAWRTLKKKLQAIALLYRWATFYQIDIAERLSSVSLFSEEEVNSSLTSYLRKSHSHNKVRKLAISSKTFNVLVMHVKEYLTWICNSRLMAIPSTEPAFIPFQQKQQILMRWLDASKITNSAAENELNKGLSEEQQRLLLELINPVSKNNPWRSQEIRYRNHLIIQIFLNFGLRPAELQTLRVEDVHIGAISSIQIKRRPHDPEDPRISSPEVKRSGRVLPILESSLAKVVDEYIQEWRPQLENKHPAGTPFLFLSDEGDPLSYPSITKIFNSLKKQDLRMPTNFSPKSLRHTFSSYLEKRMRASGIEEGRRGEILAYLRGDTSIQSHAIYIRQAVKEEAAFALQLHHVKIFNLAGVDHEKF